MRRERGERVERGFEERMEEEEEEGGRRRGLL
jgi:hypothetical protein